MGRVVHAAERFIVGHKPRQTGQTSAWICMDDRYALVEGLYRQTGGGAIGVGHDWAVAVEMGAQRRQQNTDIADMAERHGLANAPAQILGGVAAKTLNREGIRLGLHENCAAEAGAVAITGLIAQGSPELYNRARQFKPDLTEDQCNQIFSINSTFLRAQRVADPAEMAPILENRRKWHDGIHDWYFDPVPRVGLVDMDHVAPDILANQLPHTAFDARGALEANTPAYHVSMGDMPELTGALTDIIPFRTDDYLAAAAVRHAAISLVLPAPQGLDTVGIHLVESSAA